MEDLMINNTISKKEFTDCVDKWEMYTSNKLKGSIIMAKNFNIPLADIKGIEEEIKELHEGSMEVKAVKAFVGLSPFPTDCTNENDPEFQMKLFLVGIDASNTPIYDYQGKSLIFDFVIACPPVCNPN